MGLSWAALSLGGLQSNYGRLSVLTLRALPFVRAFDVDLILFFMLFHFFQEGKFRWSIHVKARMVVILF